MFFHLPFTGIECNWVLEEHFSSDGERPFEANGLIIPISSALVGVWSGLRVSKADWLQKLCSCIGKTGGKRQFLI